MVEFTSRRLAFIWRSTAIAVLLSYGGAQLPPSCFHTAEHSSRRFVFAPFFLPAALTSDGKRSIIILYLYMLTELNKRGAYV